MFPYDSSETIDFDGDGVGDNSDIFPEDLSEDTDTDGDGVGDNSDAFPDDSSEYTDTDGDGVGDNSDFYPGDPERWLYLDSQISQKEIMISILIISSIVYLFRSPKSSSEDEYSDTDFEE